MTKAEQALVYCTQILAMYAHIHYTKNIYFAYSHMLWIDTLQLSC